MKPIYLVIFASVLVACTGSKATLIAPSPFATQTVSSASSTQTDTVEPPTATQPASTVTRTIQPATETVSPTPTQKIPTDHSLIAYQSISSPDKQLMIIDPANGSTWEFSFPKGAIFATPFLAGLSPDARYFVYYEGGKVGDYGQLIVESDNLKINIMNLDNHKTIISMPVLSPEFPEVLKPLVEMTEDQYWMEESDKQAKLDEMQYTMEWTLLQGIRRVTWSPDGSLLAFASQNPGPSSDMYFFGPYSGRAWKVTAEPGNVIRLTWAPIIKYHPISPSIALETTFYYTQATRITTDVLTRAGSLTGTVGEYTYVHSWFDPYRILLVHSIDFGDPYYELALLNTYDNQQTMLWEGSLDNFAIAPDLSSMLVSSSQPNNPGEPGLFFKLQNSESALKLSDSRFWEVVYWGSEQFAYAASAPENGIFDQPQGGGTFGISATGKMYPIDEGHWILLPSPDGKLLAAYGPYRKEPGLRVFAGDGNLIASLSESIISCVKWDAGASSLAFQAGQSLYLWTVGEPSARQIASQLEDQLEYDECGFNWVNEARVK